MLEFLPSSSAGFIISPVYSLINKTINVQYNDDPTITPTDDTIIKQVNVQSNCSYLNFIKDVYNKQCNITVSGSIPIDVFDQYSVEYVDKNKSDKTQVPINSDLNNVPNNKDIFKVLVDSRNKITFYIDVNVTTFSLKNNTENYFNKRYYVEITQTYDMIKTWLNDYFKIRY